MIQKFAVTHTDQDTSTVVYYVNSLSSITSVAGAGWHVTLPSSLTKQVSEKQQGNVSPPRPAPAVSIYLPNWWKYLLLKTKRIIFLPWLCSKGIWTVLRAFVWGGNRRSVKTKPEECLRSLLLNPEWPIVTLRHRCLLYFTKK